MPGRTCCVFGCFNNGVKLQAWNKTACEIHKPLLHIDCPCLRPYGLHRFPGRAEDQDLRRKWIKYINRDGFEPNKNTTVCGIHFPDGRPTRENPCPVLFMGYDCNATPAFEVIDDHSEQLNMITIKSEVQCKAEPQGLQIGFIGAGNMAFGIAQGILVSGAVSPENVKVSAPSSNHLGRFEEMGAAVTHANAEVVSASRLVFLAVKPHLVPAVLQEVASLVTREHIIVSVAAGVTIATVEALLPPESVVLRLMPNLPCLVQEGALLFARGSRAVPEHATLLRSLLGHCGLVEEGPESWIDAHTGLSGSGVAFVYLFAEALAEGGVKMGMPSALAHRIAAQTVLGAGRMLRDSEKHPAQLRADVCTPGGTTIFGLHELEKGGLRAAVMGAVEAATDRARDLGKK